MQRLSGFLWKADEGSAGTHRWRWRYLEELEQAHAGDFVSVYFFLGQTIRMQQFRNQTLQLLFEVRCHIWDGKYKNRTALSVLWILPLSLNGGQQCGKRGDFTAELSLKGWVGGHLQPRVRQQEAGDFGEAWMDVLSHCLQLLMLGLLNLWKIRKKG